VTINSPVSQAKRPETANVLRLQQRSGRNLNPITSVVMLGAGLLACVEPARRALRINPIDALRDA
jgi:hypothetical protein